MAKQMKTLNKSSIFILIIMLLWVIGACKQREETPKVQPTEAEGKNVPRVLVVEEDNALAQHTADLMKVCLGYKVDTANAATVPDDKNQYDVIFYYHNTYPDGLKKAVYGAQSRDVPYEEFNFVFNNGWVEFGDTSQPSGVKVTRGAAMYEIPNLFDDAKLAYAVATAAGDSGTAGKIRDIPAYVKPDDFMSWCKAGFVIYAVLELTTYDGDFPSPDFGSDKPWADILAGCPDPFGIRPQYIYIDGGWRDSGKAPLEYTNEVKIPSNWKGATFICHPPFSERSFDISIGDNTFPTLHGRYWETFKLGKFNGGETLALSIKYSRDNTPLEPSKIPPMRIEAAAGPLPPEYLIYWDNGAEKLKVECNFLNDASSLTGGRLYCEMKDPSGQVTTLSAEIPAGSQHNVVSLPAAEYTPWRPDAPKSYRFRFLFQSKDGVDEYLATYGFNRISSKDGYFRFEGESGYLRGAFQHADALPGGSRDKAFFKGLKAKGFNAYFTDGVLLPAEIYTASESGVFIGRIFRNGVWRRQQLYFEPGNDVPPEFAQAPAWLGKTSLPSGESGSGDIVYSTSKLIFNVRAEKTEKDWDILAAPECMPEYQELTTALAKGELPEWVNESWQQEAPLVLAFTGVVCEDEPPAKPEMYELINLIRRQEWCAGFIIPLDSYMDELKGLMTDDFLIFDYRGFPLEKPSVLEHGSVLHLPLRYANLKPTGDEGGAISWLWMETKEEGRVNYPEPDRKGIFEMPALDIPVPSRPGKYTLHFEVMGANYYNQAVNWLDVVVE